MMIDRIQISRLQTLPSEIAVLRTEAEQEGFKFLARLAADWASGANSFNRPGECLLGVFVDGELVGVGGLNIDPYLQQADIGRVRHLYVRARWRRQGVGRLLVDRLLGAAQGFFDQVRLRTDGDVAADFYVRCGFSPVENPTASHLLNFAG